MQSHLEDINLFQQKWLLFLLLRGGTITIFVGIGLYLLGVTALGSILKGVGLLVTTIGVGTFVAGYLFPDDSAGITKAVENFEKK